MVLMSFKIAAIFHTHFFPQLERTYLTSVFQLPVAFLVKQAQN